jgi:hypothetical protein
MNRIAGSGNPSQITWLEWIASGPSVDVRFVLNSALYGPTISVLSVAGGPIAGAIGGE